MVATLISPFHYTDFTQEIKKRIGFADTLSVTIITYSHIVQAL